MTKIGAISDPKISALLSEPKLESVFKPLDELTHRILIEFVCDLLLDNNATDGRAGLNFVFVWWFYDRNGEGGIRTLGSTERLCLNESPYENGHEEISLNISGCYAF
jgi:hypothetical protein